MYVYYLHSQGIVLILETLEAFFSRARVCGVALPTLRFKC